MSLLDDPILEGGVFQTDGAASLRKRPPTNRRKPRQKLERQNSWQQSHVIIIGGSCHCDKTFVLFVATKRLSRQIFVATNKILSQQIFATTNIILSRQNDKHTFVAKNTCSVATKVCLLWQIFVATIFFFSRQIFVVTNVL